MATDNTTSEAVEGSWSPKRPRTAAEERASSHEGTDDTQVLADGIEQTREELAQTIDAIVDKVSPKKVARRTTQKAGEAAREGVHHAAEVVKETAHTATDAVKEAASAVKEKVSGSDDALPVRSPLEPVTSVAVGSASRVAAEPASASLASPLAPSSTGPSPLGADARSVDLGAVAPADTTGSLADAADALPPSVEPAGGDLPAYRPVPPPSSAVPSRTPVFAGAGAAVAVLLLVLRRRRRRGRRR